MKYFSVFNTDTGEFEVITVESIESGGGEVIEVLNSLEPAEEVEF